MKKILILLLVIGVAVSCNEQPKKPAKKEVEPSYTSLINKAKNLFGELPEIADSKDNPVTGPKVALGKALYFDTILSKNKTQSCNTCHNLNTFGVDNNPVSAGDKEGTFGGRNSPTTLNAALHIAQFWDGREPDVEAQAGGPVLNPVEMGMPDEKSVEKRLSAEEKYQKMFAQAFPEEKNPITYDNMKKAIGAFERKLMTPSRFDAFLNGDEKALNAEEIKGLETFLDKGCASCHNGPAIGGGNFQKFGVFTDYWTLTNSEKKDQGRFEVTKNEADMYVFKTPSLRNITKTYPYFHDGSVKNLKDAVRIMGKTQLNQDLTDEEINSITVFLESLTGEIPSDLKN